MQSERARQEIHSRATTLEREASSREEELVALKAQVSKSVQAAFVQGEQSGFASGSAAASVELATAKAQAAAWQARAGMRGLALPRDVRRPAPTNLPIPWASSCGASRAEVLQQIATVLPTIPRAQFPAPQPEPFPEAVLEAEAAPPAPRRKKVRAIGPFRPTNTLDG